jgi:hypothetical protein
VTLGQYDNVSAEFSLDSRLRYIREAGRELALVFTHGAIANGGSYRTRFNDAVLKVTSTFRF